MENDDEMIAIIMIQKVITVIVNAIMMIIIILNINSVMIIM